MLFKKLTSKSDLSLIWLAIVLQPMTTIKVTIKWLLKLLLQCLPGGSTALSHRGSWFKDGQGVNIPMCLVSTEGMWKAIVLEWHVLAQGPVWDIKMPCWKFFEWKWKLWLETTLVLERAQCHGELLHLCRLGGKGDEDSGNIWEHLPSVVCLKPWGVEQSTWPWFICVSWKGGAGARVILRWSYCWD